MWCVFSGCYNLSSFKGIKKWDMSNVKDVDGMFECNYKIKEINELENWKTNNIESFWNTFSYCPYLKSIKGIGNWDIRHLKNKSFPFQNSNNLDDEVKNSNLYKFYL